MNRLVRLIVLSFPIVCMTAHAAEPRVQDFTLDDPTVYFVPVWAGGCTQDRLSYANARHP